MANYLRLTVEDVRIDYDAVLRCYLKQVTVNESETTIDDIISANGVLISDMWYPYHTIKVIQKYST